MSSRDYIRHVVSANTSINGQKVGDEVYDPTTNKLYKTLAVGGTQVTNSEVLLNPGFLPNSILLTNSSGVLSNTPSLSFYGANNTLVTSNYRANGSIIIGNITTSNIATLQFNSTLNSIDFIFSS
jgi:hypothetical protein